MPRIQLNDGQEITHGDLSAISKALELELFDRLIYELMGRQRDRVFADSFKVTYVNATTVQVAAGNGVQYDNTQVSPEPMTRLLYLASSVNKTIGAADATNPRIDIVCIKANRAVTATASRNVKSAIDATVSTQTVDTKTDWSSDLLVTAGTPAGSPVAPSIPAGYIKLAEVLVTAVTGVSGSGAITDKRTRFQKPNDVRQTVSVSATYTIDREDNLVLADASGGAFTCTLPRAADVPGQEFTIKNVGATGIVTVGSVDTLDGAATQTLDFQNTSITVRSTGTVYYLL